MSQFTLGDFKKLGFGLMRLPVLPDGSIDIEQVKQMTDLFLSRGFTYFDTAYVYGNGDSERAFREAVVKRYPREAYLLADKLPLWGVERKEEFVPLFETSLERTGVDYFDYYLLHNVSGKRIEMAEKAGAWEFLRSLKERGLAKHIGFSTHANAQWVDEILTRHPEAEFVQLQINYADWENGILQSRLCYEAARRHNTPVTVMEPVKGGFLAQLPPEAEQLFKSLHPTRSPASWAIRFCASLEGIVTVLSGMSALSHVEDNLRNMEDFQPLSQEELAAVARVREILVSQAAVPCTNCEYCLEHCPQSIPIPHVFRAFNEHKVYGLLPGIQRYYNIDTTGRGKAGDCIACRACEEQCPQHIEISAYMPQASQIFDGRSN